MTAVAHLAYAGGGGVFPADSEYERQLLRDHVMHRAQRSRVVRLELAAQSWTIDVLRRSRSNAPRAAAANVCMPFAGAHSARRAVSTACSASDMPSRGQKGHRTSVSVAPPAVDRPAAQDSAALSCIRRPTAAVAGAAA